ncbi:MAG: hypothetical protein M3Q42_08340 [Pseudomonadota bacterium]|nr:hypothetical protein [Pseudomonadota bacterium]
MLIRAIIVLLLILNIGIAAWWLARPKPEDGGATASADAVSQPIPRLLLADQSLPAAPVAGGQNAASSEQQAAAAEYCAIYGPYASEEAAAQAGQRLQPPSVSVSPRAQGGPPFRGWKVWLPPFDDMEQVQAMSERIAEAGFKDQFIVREGRYARSLALGRFASEAPARQHADKLLAAGFPARAEPIGTGAPVFWLDVVAADADPQRLETLAAAPEAREVDCSTWR